MAALFITVVVLSFILTSCNTIATPTTTQPTASATAEPTPTNTPEPTATPKPLYHFDRYALPQYAKEYLGKDLWDDYNTFLDALYEGETVVTFTKTKSMDQLEKIIRTMCCFFIPKDFISGKKYLFADSEPFTFDKETKTLTIKYLLPKEEYVKKVNAFVQTMESLINEHVTDMNNKFETAKEMYLCVVNHLDYVEDYTLTTYDAFMSKLALCEHYAKMYRYLLVQAGIENYLFNAATDGDMYHMWNIVRLGDDLYHMDPTWDCGNLFFFGMDDTKSKAEHKYDVKTQYANDALLNTNLTELVCDSDKYNDYWIDHNPTAE